MKIEWTTCKWSGIVQMKLNWKLKGYIEKRTQSAKYSDSGQVHLGGLQDGCLPGHTTSDQDTPPQTRTHHLGPGPTTSDQDPPPWTGAHHLGPGHTTLDQDTPPWTGAHHIGPGPATSDQDPPPQTRAHHLGPGCVLCTTQ